MVRKKDGHVALFVDPFPKNRLMVFRLVFQPPSPQNKCFPMKNGLSVHPYCGGVRFLFQVRCRMRRFLPFCGAR
jgi:hypothetical protein